MIDLFGTHGGLLEHRAAILASHGFVVFALAFFAYKDLPETHKDLELEYFIEAVEWLARHPKVYNRGIGIIGSSFGGQVALQVAGKCPIVKSVVAVSSPVRILFSVKFKGKSIGFQGDLFSIPRPKSKLEFEATEARIPFIHYINTFIPVEEIEGKMLLIVGTEDTVLPVAELTNKVKERLASNGRPPLKCLRYPGAGHLIEVPYMPMCKKSFHRVFNRIFPWGGNVVDHSSAQEHSWKAILGFLNSNLNKADAKM